jgi:hypothetical protein
MPIGVRVVRQRANQDSDRVFELNVMEAMSQLGQYKPEIISSGMDKDGWFWVMIKWVDQG